ncbi:MAG: UDP-2,3-diacylglucosamine diphosphatase [Burkholderiales bacterium]|nr:UDP-2,3-diacylglucosamine diphosphatase [Burkholderiales bacterium]
MTYLVLSDLHLSPQRPLLTKLFRQFCAGPAQQAARVYILGDLFDFWVGDDQMRELFAKEIVSLLATISASNRRLFVQHGNRDFLLGKRFAQHAKATLISDPYVVEMFGARTVLTHGDILCTDDTHYQELRRVWRSPARLKQIMYLPYWVRRRIARSWREQSERDIGTKPAYLMDVNQDAVIDMMQRYDAARLIHGHTHRRAEYSLIIREQPARRFVLANWYDECASYLEISNNAIQYREIKAERSSANLGMHGEAKTVATIFADDSKNTRVPI